MGTKVAALPVLTYAEPNLLDRFQWFRPEPVGLLNLRDTGNVPNDHLYHFADEVGAHQSTTPKLYLLDQ